MSDLVAPRGLHVLVPLAFAVTVPAEALTGRIGAPTPGLVTGFTVLVVVLTRWSWNVRLRNYSGASA